MSNKNSVLACSQRKWVTDVVPAPGGINKFNVGIFGDSQHDARTLLTKSYPEMLQ